MKSNEVVTEFLRPFAGSFAFRDPDPDKALTRNTTGSFYSKDTFYIIGWWPTKHWRESLSWRRWPAERYVLKLFHAQPRARIFSNVVVDPIRIRIDLAVLDPDPYWECRSGSRSMEIDQNKQINLVSCLSKRFLYSTFVVIVPRRLFITALQWLAIAQGPKIS